MCKKKTHGSYGFTTQPEDPFHIRIAKEAKPHDNAIVVTVKNSLTNAKEVLLLVRANWLPHAGTPFTLAGKHVKRSWGFPIPRTGFRYAIVKDGDPRKNVNIVKNELQKIKNFVDHKVTRVLVEPIA